MLADWNKEWIPQFAEVLLYFAGVYLIGLLLYHVTRKVTPTVLSGFVYDFIKTMLICAYPIGLLLVRTQFGDISFLAVLVPLILLTVFTIPGEATPVAIWVKLFQKRLSLGIVFVKTMILVISGFAAFYVGIFVLRLQLHKTLFGFERSTTLPTTCQSALKVPVYQGFLLEMLGVMYDSWFMTQKLSPNVILDTSLKITNTGILVIAGSHLTGMFIHPSKASGLTFGCGQTSYVAHIIVYWIGPFVGAWLSTKLQKRLRLSWISDDDAKRNSVEVNNKKANKKKRHYD